MYIKVEEMKKIVLLLALFCMTLSAAAVKKTDLSVLYVGGHSDIDTFDTPYDTLANAKSIVARTKAWVDYLNTYFTTVKAVQGKDYDFHMSYNYDVTIIDGDPKPLEPKQVIYKNGRFSKMVFAKYFPDDFDRPVITIADEGETVGRRIGTKNDWYCLCLLGKAFNLRRDNAIFKGPYPVKITLKDQPTPDGALEFAKMMGDKVPAMTPMWTVHNHDYGNTQGYKIGMVTREWGYLDSPDAEVISGGQCAKSYDAIAIGRHANFMTWGFAGSPADMTEEAKPVFANAVVYMAKFKGHRVIARKLNEGIATRFNADQMARMASKEIYDDYAADIKDINDMIMHIADSLKAVQEAGGKVDGPDTMYLGVTPDQLQKIPTYENYLKERYGELYEKFGTDTKAYRDYYTSNKPYFYGTLDGYDLLLDTDAKSLGIANNDIRLLEKAVELWQSGKDVAMGKRLLYRYTLLRYNTPGEFEKWLKRYGKKLFFSESGGWKWLVNDLTPGTPGNDYSVAIKEGEEKEATQGDKLKTTESDPVALSSTLTKSGSDCVLTIRMKIHPGYHIYNTVSSKDPYIATTYKITGTGYELNGNLLKPIGRRLDSNGSMIYENEVEIKQKFTAKGHGTIVVEVNYQACNATACLMPMTKTIKETF
jgi:hypothetical protein